METIKKVLIFTILCLFSACELEEFTPSVQEEAVKENSGQQSSSAILTLVNQLRSEGCRCGSRQMPPVAALTQNTKLNKAALRHAIDMHTNDFFDHTGSDGTVVADRVTDSGYSWQTVGENIAWGYQDIHSVFAGWKDSPGHCRNMMNPHFKHMGIARMGDYWVQTFARPRGF